MSFWSKLLDWIEAMVRQIDGGGTAQEGIGGAAFVPDATSTLKGILALSGDLGGTADAPTVPGLASKANSTQVDQKFTTSEKSLLDSATSAGTPSMLVQRDSSGKFTVAEIFGTTSTPTGASSLVRRDYVDAQIAGVSTSASVQTFVKTASYSFILSDANAVIEYNASAAGTFTVPLNSAVAYPIGTLIECCQIGSGKLTIAATSGVTLRSAASLITRTQYSSISLRKRGTDDWVIAGDLA